MTDKEKELQAEAIDYYRKQIADLEHQLTHRNCLDCSNHSSKLRMRTLELEKENAELKEELEYAETHCLFHSDCPTQRENAELEQKLEQTEKDLADYQFNYPTIKELEKENEYYHNRCKDCALELSMGKLKDLEKENEELKLKLEALEGQTPWNGIKDKSEVIGNLTRAKEYIKLLLMNCVGVYESTGKTIAEIQAEAEQFISEVEK